MTRTFQSLLCAVALTAFGASPAEATSYYALDGMALWEIDDAGNSNNLGNISGGPPFGFGPMDVAPDGTIYAVGPGLVSGFTVFSIDPSSMTATAVAGPVLTTQTGGIGIAVDPTGNTAWVAGFVGLSLNVNFQEIDLNTGTATDRGNFGGNAWGLAFDAAGDLYYTRQGAGVEADLVLIDQTDASLSTILGTIPAANLDVSFGLDLASDRGAGYVSILSRSTDEIFPLDTVGVDVCGPGLAVTGIGNLFTIGAVPEEAPATSYYGLDGTALYEIDAAGNSVNLGGVSGGPAFGFGPMDVAPDGTIYAVGPGLISGFSVYSIDPGTLTAALVAGPVLTTQTGGIGIAIDPTGATAWVAGFVGLSLNVNFQEIDLNTGTATDRGNFGGNSWGLAFDDSGSLFLARQGAGLFAELFEIDQTDASLSTLVGKIPETVDVSFGLDLASARGSGNVSLLSRANDDIYVLDTATACVGPKTTVTGIGNLFSIGERDTCPGGSTLAYGAGCAGSGGFVPSLTVDGCPIVGNTLQFTVSNGLGGSTAIFLLGVGQANVPVGGGCSLLINTVFPATFSVPLGGAGNGGGSVTFFSPVLPASAAGATVNLQAFVVDAGNPIGGAGTNGLEINFAP